MTDPFNRASRNLIREIRVIRGSLNNKLEAWATTKVWYDQRMQLALMESLAVTLLISLFSGDGTSKGFAACLPAGVELEEVVSAPQLKSATATASKRVTVRETLLQLEAHCKEGKLVAGSGREIRFYRLVGCWGNPPADYLDQLARQDQELQRLRKNYTVVEIACAQIDQRQIP